MKIRTVLNKKKAEIMIGQVGIGVIAFPWIRVFWDESNHDISFWEWFFGPPTITYIDIPTSSSPFDILFKKCVQLRVMWFAIQVTT